MSLVTANSGFGGRALDVPMSDLSSPSALGVQKSRLYARCSLHEGCVQGNGTMYRIDGFLDRERNMVSVESCLASAGEESGAEGRWRGCGSILPLKALSQTGLSLDVEKPLVGVC